jgi:putative oxidoreductase
VALKIFVFTIPGFVPLALETLGSIFLVHGANGWLSTNRGGGWEYPAFWAVSLAVWYLLGDGAMARRPVGRKT